MPKNNIYLPKENLARVEEVREIEEKELITPEKQAQVINDYKERWGLINNKSKLSPAARSKIIKRHGADYLSERAFDHDIALMQMYGPGFWGDVGAFVGKTVATTVAAGIIVSTAGTAAPVVGGVMWLGGKAAEEIGKETDCQLLRSVGSFTKDTGFGTATAGLFTGEGAVKTAVKNGWSLDKVERINKAFAVRDYAQNGVAICEHNRHRERGISYDRNCELCNL